MLSCAILHFGFPLIRWLQTPFILCEIFSCFTFCVRRSSSAFCTCMQWQILMHNIGLCACMQSHTRRIGLPAEFTDAYVYYRHCILVRLRRSFFSQRICQSFAALLFFEAIFLFLHHPRKEPSNHLQAFDGHPLKPNSIALTRPTYKYLVHGTFSLHER